MYGGAITPITKPGVLQSNLMKQELRMSAAPRERESRMLTASGKFQIAMDYRAATLEGLDTTDRFLISAAAIPAREQLDRAISLSSEMLRRSGCPLVRPSSAQTDV
jgi:hypothetical protein